MEYLISPGCSVSPGAAIGLLRVGITFITFLEVLLASLVRDAVCDKTDGLLDAGNATIANGTAALVHCSLDGLD